MQQKLFFSFLKQRPRAFGKNIKKESQKPRPKMKKICILYIYREYLLRLQPNASGSGNFVE